MTPCPAPEQLGRLLAGEPAGPDEDLLAAHVQACLTCQEVLERLTAGQAARADTVSGPEAAYLQQLAQAPPPPLGDRGEPACCDMLSTLQPESTERTRYTLTRLHAKGGIGQVWLARDEDLGREVALKELKAERADQPAVWARFVEEAKITGQLEHPGIVPVYELTRRAADAKPFYTMRFIRGRTLSQACRDYHERRTAGQAGPLELRQLLGAFVAVCNAVAYAHSRGVIHRDIKGQNVILGKYGEAVVLDWGLAKVVNEQPAGPTAASLLPVALTKEDSRDETLQGQVLGTPAYMAPEQADGRLDEIGPLTDVYGLGGILYEILTGRAPFSGNDTREVLWRVAHEAPVRPRERVAATPRALEAICLKALAKEPGARYASATALADDVQHYLADEPVAAFREGWATRLARWGRRHRSLVAGAAVLLVAAVVTLAAGTLLLERTNRLMQEQRDLANESFRQARQAVDEYFTTVSESTLLNSPQPGLQPLRKELLESALRYYEGFLQQRGDDPAVQTDLAQANLRVGVIRYEIGTKADALAALQRACELYDALQRSTRDNPAFRAGLAKSYRLTGRVHCDMGNSSEALAASRQAIALGEELAREFPAVADYRKELAWGYNTQGRVCQFRGCPLDALVSYRQAASVSEQLFRELPGNADIQRGLGASYGNVGVITSDLGRIPETVEANERALGVFADLARTHPENAGFQADVGQICNNIGFFYQTLGNSAKARANLERSLSIFESLVRSNPAVSGFKLQLVMVTSNLGDLHIDDGRAEQGLRFHQQALQIAEHLVAGDPAVSPVTRREQLDSHRGLGKALAKLGKPAEALVHLRKAIEIGPQSPENEPSLLYALARAQALYSAVLGQGTGSLAGSEQAEQRRWADEALQTLRQAVAAGWRHADWLRKDPDLEALRSRADFQQLLREVKEKAEAQARPSGPDEAATPAP
jgi:serine/threonine-protein kinase